MSIENPLGMQDLLVNTIAGSLEIFTFLSIIIISAMSAKFNMPKSIFLVIIALFGIIMAQWIGGLYLILILLSGLMIFTALARLFR